MPFWLIALAIAGGGYYLFSKKGTAAAGTGFISANEYVDSKHVHWSVAMAPDGITYQFKTQGYGGDSGIDGQDKASVIASVETFSANHTPV